MSTLMKKRKLASGRAAPSAISLDREVRKLKRQVASNAPEVRQQSYTVTVVAANTSAIPLLDPTTIIGDEFKLLRITVHGDADLNSPSGIGTWGMLYSPNEGYSSLEALPDQTSPHGETNYLYIPDKTRCRVWTRQHKARQSQNNESYPLVMEKKFGIPMKVGTSLASQADPTVVHNQIFYSGSQVDTASPRTLYVTIWFTDS